MCLDRCENFFLDRARAQPSPADIYDATRAPPPLRLLLRLSVFIRLFYFPGELHGYDRKIIAGLSGRPRGDYFLICLSLDGARFTRSVTGMTNR